MKKMIKKYLDIVGFLLGMTGMIITVVINFSNKVE